MTAGDKAPTREELVAGSIALVEAGRAIYQTLVEAGPLGAPESIIYLALAERGMDGRAAERIIDLLVSGGLVERRAHALVAVTK